MPLLMDEGFSDNSLARICWQSALAALTSDSVSPTTTLPGNSDPELEKREDSQVEVPFPMLNTLFRPRTASSAVWRALSTSKPELKVAGTKGSNIKYFKIYRWDPEQKQKPYVSTYPINLDECGPMVLGTSLCLYCPNHGVYGNLPHIL